jgi:hypothetical protein
MFQLLHGYGRSCTCICVLVVSVCPPSTIILYDCGTVPTLWYISFILFYQFTNIVGLFDWLKSTIMCVSEFNSKCCWVCKVDVNLIISSIYHDLPSLSHYWNRSNSIYSCSPYISIVLVWTYKPNHHRSMMNTWN